MPRTLKIDRISTLKDYTSLVEEALPAAGHLLWYRGVGEAGHDLVPGFYRHPPTSEPGELQALEKKMVHWFRQRSIPFQSRPLDGSWECLFVMQHFGVPTRLLDWTENPYIALYFALAYASKEKRRGKWVYLKDAAVWLLNPAQWNAAVLDRVKVEGGVLSTEAHVASSYEPTKDLTRDEPVAIYGAHNSARIVAQRGVFTVAGASLEPMNKVYENSAKLIPQDCLRKIEFPKESIAELLRSLLSMGFTESVVFPDMEGLARETKRIFGY